MSYPLIYVRAAIA